MAFETIKFRRMRFLYGVFLSRRVAFHADGRIASDRMEFVVRDAGVFLTGEKQQSADHDYDENGETYVAFHISILSYRRQRVAVEPS